MNKCKAIRNLLLAAFLANFCLVSSLFSQVSNLLKQNSINDILLVQSEGETALVFRGTIKALVPSDIDIQTSEGSNRFTITFRNSLWDTREMDTQTKLFGESDPIANISITNDISSGKRSEAMFSIIFEVETKQNITPNAAAQISATEVRIPLKGRPRVITTKAKTAAQEREEAAKLQIAIQKEAQRAQVTAKESVEAVLQQYKKPSVVQISILNSSGFAKGAYGLSVYLGKLKKEYIEESLGMKMEIVNISNSKETYQDQSTIYFRNNYLKPALFLATLLKGDQRVMPLPDQEEKQGVDIEIYLGKDYK